MSTFVTDSLLAKTSSNGVSVDGMKHLDGVRTHSNEVGSATIAASENGLIVGPATITGTINVDGHLEIV
jgi:hypothetical protein|tara:strand:- start:1866 stop:2072 length:207 start_codon:yes stop_codon:yes gene_type:complete